MKCYKTLEHLAFYVEDGAVDISPP